MFHMPPQERFKSIKPNWFSELILNCSSSNLDKFYVKKKILRAKSKISKNQKQTQSTFSFKWKKKSSLQKTYSNFHANWLNQKYGNIEDNLKLYRIDSKPLILDAGCGAGFSTMLYFKNVLDKIKLVAVDISAAVDIFKENLEKEKINNVGLLQCDLNKLPFKNNTFDFIFSEGVLHHTNSTEKAIYKLVKKLKPNGIFMFYIYKSKAPVREFTDDFIRKYLQKKDPPLPQNRLRRFE